MKYFESLYPDESFFEAIESINVFLKQGNSCQLIGLPGVGKSNLLRLLSYNKDARLRHFGENQKFVHFVYLNFAEVLHTALTDVNKYIFLSLADSLRDREMEEEHRRIHEIFKEHLVLNDELLLFQGLKEAINYLTIEKKLSIIFLFDNFSSFLPSIENSFFANLKILRNSAKYRFAAIFALNRPLEDVFGKEIFAQFYEFLIDKNVYLPINDTPSLKFRLDYLQKQTGRAISEKNMGGVFKLTGGHNNLTKLSFECILETDKAINVLAEFLVSKPSITSALFDIWDSLIEPEKEQLLEKDVNNNLFLENAGLVKNRKITIPLFKQFIKKGLHKTTAPAKITFDKNTMQIRLGGKLISSELTSLEFNLLNYLADNEGEMLTRDEIITAVWKENASTAGVSDQAFDQLVFRLRKKIEHNPNSPTHILSVKGRGLVFKS
jgi:DNA-binding winged helix-turn-helix (wHTH) protein